MSTKGPIRGQGRALRWNDKFSFRCHKDIDCFNTCCRDITIFLDPLDVIMLRKGLGMTSTLFLGKYTVRIQPEATGVPAVVLKMRDDEDKKCPFVTPEGCSVYFFRPYSCRMYPLDTDESVEYRFIVGPEKCHGLLESEEWTVERWRKEEGLYPYDDIDHDLRDVMQPQEQWDAPIRDERMQDMMYMALYDIDRFREFVFESTLLQKFKLDDDIVERIRTNDVDLLYFAGQWLRLALFGKRGKILVFDKDFLNKKKAEVFRR